MGSLSSKATVPSQVKAVASAARQYHDTSETGLYQAPAHQATRVKTISPQPLDDINIKPFTQIALQRRYSEPAQTAKMATDRVRHIDAFESFIATRNFMAIDIDHANLISPAPVEQVQNFPPTVPTKEDSKNPPETKEPEIQCVACCTPLPNKKDPRYPMDVIEPCRLCNGTYCIECVKSMFVEACRDFTRMPPRCCLLIHLHLIKPHLSIEEITEYRSKYEEWSTPKPFYCPRLTCSVFIPERLLPQQAGSKGKRKMDSGIGTPTSSDFHCPKCDGEICVDCRQMAHPSSLCASSDFGIDAETAELLKAWGYKRCPKCSQGVKKMYGCNHMECRCGANFCWGCLQSRDDCDGSCYEGDDEDEDYGSEPDEAEPVMVQGNDADLSTTHHEMATEGDIPLLPQASIGTTSDTTTSAQTPARPRNLDGGSANYWENQGLYFGEEPHDDIRNRICHHTFKAHTISLASSFSPHTPAHELECVKCWSPIRPVIDTSQSTTTQAKLGRKQPLLRNSGVRGGRGRAVYAHRGRRDTVGARLRPAYARGLSASNASSVDAALHLTAHIPPVTSRRADVPTDTMEIIQSAAAIDSPMDIPTPTLVATLATQPKKKPASASPTSAIFTTPPTILSAAQECEDCGLLVCQTCADQSLDQQNADSDASDAEE